MGYHTERQRAQPGNMPATKPRFSPLEHAGLVREINDTAREVDYICMARYVDMLYEAMGAHVVTAAVPREGEDPVSIFISNRQRF